MDKTLLAIMSLLVTGWLCAWNEFPDSPAPPRCVSVPTITSLSEVGQEPLPMCSGWLSNRTVWWGPCKVSDYGRVSFHFRPCSRQLWRKPFLTQVRPFALAFCQGNEWRGESPTASAWCLLGSQATGCALPPLHSFLSPRAPSLALSSHIP